MKRLSSEHEAAMASHMALRTKDKAEMERLRAEQAEREKENTVLKGEISSNKGQLKTCKVKLIRSVV